MQPYGKEEQCYSLPAALKRASKCLRECNAPLPQPLSIMLTLMQLHAVAHPTYLLSSLQETPHHITYL